MSPDDRDYSSGIVLQMTKREYVLSTIKHREGDKVPYCIQISEKAINLYGNKLLQDFNNKEVQDDLKQGNINYKEAINFSIGNYMTLIPAHWWQWDYKNTSPIYKDPESTPDVMPAIIREDTAENFEEYNEHTKWIAEKYQTYIVSLIYGSHFEKANFIRGIENFLADMGNSPEFAKKFLTFIIDLNMEILPKIVKNKYIDAVLLGSDWGTQNDLIMSPQTWNELIMPGEEREYAIIKAAGKHIIIHSCGCILRIIPNLIEMGVDILNPVQSECMDLNLLKETYGSKLTYWGGISTQKTLPYGTPHDVIRETEQVIKLMSRNGGYITCPSQVIQEDVPYENLKALIETVRHYG
ncbi:MAG: hypothetical protein FWD78_03765 [Treponema sp.]|nr:hypothetical protein [Treponema sp.]